MTKITFTRETDGRKGRYVAQVPGIEEAGEMTFTQRSAGVFSLDHTEVPEAARGLGIAVALAQHVIKDARERGQKIIPLCPFFKKYVDRHPEESADVIQNP